MRRVLAEVTIEGVATTLPFHRSLLESPEFVEGRFDTEFVTRSRDGKVGG